MGAPSWVSTRDGGVEIVDFEPKQDAVSNACRGVAHGTVMVIDVPSVKLKDQSIRAPLAGVKLGVPQTLVLSAAVATHASQKDLIPPARCLNVAAVDQRLSAHSQSLTRAPHQAESNRITRCSVP